MVSGHPAFPDGTVEGPHVRLPPGGLAPVVAHAADLNRIGIMYLWIHKQILPAERQGDVQGNVYVITWTVAAVNDGHHHISAEADTLEILLLSGADESVKPGIEVNP